MSREKESRRALQKEAKKRRRKIWIVLLVLVVVLAAVARPGYRRLKTKRAENLSSQAEALVEQNKYEDAAAKYRAALQLDPLGYVPLRGAAVLSSKLNQAMGAVELWEQVLRLPRATESDRVEYAAALLQAGRMPAAEKELTELLKEDPSTRVLLLASAYAALTGDHDRAIEYSRLATKRAPQDPAPEARLAELLASSTEPSKRKEARDILWKIAGGNTTESRAAIEALARAPELTADEQERVRALLKKLSPFTITDALLYTELQLMVKPDAAAAIYDDLVATWAKDEDTLPLLVEWLNLHRQSDRVLTLLPVDVALKNDVLMLARLDALAAQRRWDEIDATLSRADLKFSPSMVESFRARAAMERGAALDADVHWNKAIALAAGDAYKLRFVANFAETSNANEPALRAYDQLARLPQHASFALAGQQRLAAKMRDMAAARSAAEKMLALSADDPEAQARVAYYNLLLDKDVDASLKRANELVTKFPMRLEFRVTAALGYLRKHDPGSALAQFTPAGAPPIVWEKTPPWWRAVYAAALLANDENERAENIIRTIPQDRLSREEAALLSPVGSTAAPN